MVQFSHSARPFWEDLNLLFFALFGCPSNTLILLPLPVPKSFILQFPLALPPSALSLEFSASASLLRPAPACVENPKTQCHECVFTPRFFCPHMSLRHRPLPGFQKFLPPFRGVLASFFSLTNFSILAHFSRLDNSGSAGRSHSSQPMPFRSIFTFRHSFSGYNVALEIKY